LGLSILGTLDDRVGDTYEPDGCAVAPAVAAAAATPAVDLPTRKPAAAPTKKPGSAPCPLFSPSVWGRFFGQTVHNRYSAFADPYASGNLGGFQGGIDILRGSLISGHYERMGLYGAYGDVSADVDGLITNAAANAYVNAHTGSMNLTAWSGGAYWTHIGPGGWYVDTSCRGPPITARPEPSSPGSALTVGGSSRLWRAAFRSPFRNWGLASWSSRRGRSCGRRFPSGTIMTALAMSRSATRPDRAGASGFGPNGRS
jgi:hypothetical protein